MLSYRRFLAELKRRRVFRVAAVYGAVGYGVLQLADILVPALELPDSMTRAIALVIVLAFPIALVLAWAFEVTPEGVRRTESAPEEAVRISAEPRSRRWPIGIAALAGTVLLAWGAWWTLRPADSAAGDAGPVDEAVLTVLPFAVEGSPDVHYLGDGIVSLLSTKLDGAGNLRSVDSRSVLRLASREGYAPGDPDGARRIATFFGSGLYLSGDIVEAAGRMQVSAELRKTNGDRIAEASVERSADEVFDIVDELTGQLLSELRGGPAARVQRIAAVTTSSLPALKSFLEGEEHFRAGQFTEGMESFRRATEEDSLFALAYYRLSLAAEWSFADKTSVDAAETAARLSHRLSERDRRILEAYHLRRLGQNQEAAVRYRSILGTYPDEMEAWLDLSEILFHASPLHGEPFTAAKETLRHVIEFDPSHSTALIHLARIAAYEGNAAAVDTLTGRFLGLNPEAGRHLEMSAVRAIGMRDSAALARLRERLGTADEPGLGIAAWSAGVFAGDFEIARLADESLARPERSPEARRLGYAQLAFLAAADGREQDERDAIRSLTELSHGTGLEYEAMLALLPFRSTPPATLRRLRDELLRLDPITIETSDNPSELFTVHDGLHPFIRYYLLGLLSAQLGMEAAARSYADSLDALPARVTDGSLPQDLALAVRAEQLRAAGQTEAALRTLASQSRQTWYTQTAASPLFSRSRERFVQAELLIELGRSDEARRWLETIDQLSIFDIPYREPARERLAGLLGPGIETRNAPAAAAEGVATT
ncbi:MAG: hypothetical protein PVF05_09775 [Gemmatimonadales bacterium]|jgi:tetratricopeptide (TPR) repeat protein